MKDITLQLQELLQNKDFVAKMQGISVEEGLAVLKEYGIEASDEEFRVALEKIAGISEDGELQEQDLNNVAGGSFLNNLKNTAAGMWEGFYGHLKKNVKDVIGKVTKIFKGN